MELQKAIVNRCSIRKFTDYFVTDDEIAQILSAGRMAQSWANTQVWRFLVVRERELIHSISQLYNEENPAQKCSDSASALIVICAKLNESGTKKGQTATTFKEWFLFDIGVTTQNICLTAYELGLGSVVIGALDHAECNKLLHIPKDFTSVVVIPVGKPQNPEKTGPGRNELKDLVYLDRFGDKFTRVF